MIQQTHIEVDSALPAWEGSSKVPHRVRKGRRAPVHAAPELAAENACRLGPRLSACHGITEGFPR